MQKSALSATACAVFKRIYPIFLLILLAAGGSAPLFAQSGEAGLRLPDLHSALFLGTIPGPTLLMVGLGVSALGTAATSYFNSINQTLVLPPTDPGSYTYIMSQGGTLDVASMGGAVSFPVEQSMGSGVRFFQIGVCSQSSAPAIELGGINTTTGGSLTLSPICSR